MTTQMVEDALGGYEYGITDISFAELYEAVADGSFWQWPLAMVTRSIVALTLEVHRINIASQKGCAA